MVHKVCQARIIAMRQKRQRNISQKSISPILYTTKRQRQKQRQNLWTAIHTLRQQHPHLAIQPNQHVPTPDVRSIVMRRSNLKRLQAIPFHGNTNTLAIRRIQRRHTRLMCTVSAPTGNIPNCNRAASTILSINILSVGGHLTMIYTNKRFSQNNSRGKLTSG
jgi:hypothetical protein